MPVRVSVELALVAVVRSRLVGLRVAVRPVAGPVIASTVEVSLTVPVKPSLLVAVTVGVAIEPTLRERMFGLAVRVKCGPVTVTSTVVELGMNVVVPNPSMSTW